MTNTIASTFSSLVTLYGAPDNPTTITASGLLKAGLFAYALGSNTEWTITNAGSILGNGVALANSGTVENDGRIVGVETTASGFGVYLLAGSSVLNQASASINGYNAIDGIMATTVVNDGTISGSPYVDVFEGGLFFGSGVTLHAGGSITNQTDGRITGGEGVFSNGAVSTIENSGTIIGQDAGVNLSSGGLVTNQRGGFINGDYGVIGINVPATVVNAGIIQGLSGYGAIKLDAGGRVTNQGSGEINAFHDGILGFGGALTIENAGTISSAINAVGAPSGFANRVIVDPGAVFIGTVDGGNTIGSTVVSTLELAPTTALGTITGIGTQFIDFGSIQFDSGAGWFVAGNTTGLSGTITGFALGDTIEITGINVTGSSYADGILTLDDAAGSATLNLLGIFSTTDFLVTNSADGAAISLACFRAGTRIRTLRGEIEVDHLSVGDEVAVLPTGKTLPIVWIGRRIVDCRRHPRPERVWPVRVLPGAFGPGQPHRELFLSPDHAVYVEDVLIPIKYLIDGGTIAQVPMPRVNYFHIELPVHAILLADGLPTESYLDTGNRVNFSNENGLTTLLPDFSARSWEAFGCARLVVTGPELDSVRARIRQCAAALTDQRIKTCSAA